ncbi:hypothetical protein SCUP234_08389 [Seiridium cupressi]
MTPQADIPIAATVLGAIGTVFWCIQLVPQIWTNWRTKSTDGLPGTMMFLWALYPATKLHGIMPCELESNSDIRPPPYKAGNEMAPTVIGIIAAILLAAGLLPPYDQIWRRRGRVVGINWLFLSMDFSGALFSLLALAAQNTFDVLGGVLYIVCCVLELGIFLSQLIWVFRTRQVRKRAATLGKTVGDILITCEVHGIPFKFAERGRRKTGLPDVELGKNQGKVQTVEQFQHEPA